VFIGIFNAGCRCQLPRQPLYSTAEKTSKHLKTTQRQTLTKNKQTKQIQQLKQKKPTIEQRSLV
jgi:hypothetical protein